ncbi:MAG: hypothetical protein VKN13_01420 [Cyanobacteriota bacterium]|nr:hypothetical protein [Cyanobacteriota bacterium]
MPLDRTTVSSPQVATIRSWIEAGFHPISINLNREIQRFPDLPATLSHFDVETVVVDPQWPVVPEAPLCPFHDFLDAVAERSQGGALAIINADIRLASSPDQLLAKRVDGLSNHDYLVAQRSDISTWEDGRKRRMIHAYGFDFIAFRSPWIDRVKGALTPDLGFGLPWWDHYLPLALAAFGAQTHLVDPRWCEHDMHAFKWNWDHYCRIGRTAARQFQEALVTLPDSLPARAWLDALEMETVHPELPKRWAELWRRLAMTEGVPNPLAKIVLGRLAAANVRLILQSATTGALPVLQELG